MMEITVSRREFTATLLLALLRRPLPRNFTRAIPVKRPPEYTFKIIRTFPHDSEAFTQGLVYRDGFLYEDTGLNGRSSLRKVRLETGEVVQRVDLSNKFFGEGITLFENRVIQLTWQSQTGFVYNLADFRLLRQFTYSGEGWGLTTSGRELFMSDGTSLYAFWMPSHFPKSGASPSMMEQLPLTS
jgi:glutaminyl-peptide cyclotransferase